MNELTYNTPNGIDFDRLIERRNQLVGTRINEHDVPCYWLLPEVNTIIDAIGQIDARENAMVRRLLATTLWRTGGRIGEVLDIRPNDISSAGEHYFITLRTLKNRSTKKRPTRAIEIANDAYIAKLLGYIDGAAIKPNERIFDLIPRTTNNWIKRAAQHAGMASEHASNHTFRHSFAINYILQADPTKGNTITALKQLMGHSMVESTMMYLDVLSVDNQSGTGSMQW